MATVAFVSFSLKSRDSVAVETEKWFRILGELGHEPCRVAGYIPDAGEEDHILPELNHLDPEIEAFTGALFGKGGRRDDLVDELDRLAGVIEAGLERVFGDVGPDLVVAQNIFSLPLNLPLSAALCRWLERTGTACIAVHHDYCWDDPRFISPALPDIVTAYIPAPLPQILHVSMDARGRDELYSRSGLAATQVARCHDFGGEAAAAQGGGVPHVAPSRLRELLLFLPAGEGDCQCLDRSIGFLKEFRSVSGRSARLLLGGDRGGFGSTPGERLPAEIESEILFAADGGGGGPAGAGRYLPYEYCDAVIIPDACRGFGNSLLESIVYRKPLLVADSDEADALRSRGVQFLMLDERAAERLVSLMEHPDLMAEMVNRNFELGRKHFSLEVLRGRVAELMASLVPGGGSSVSS